MRPRQQNIALWPLNRTHKMSRQTPAAHVPTMTLSNHTHAHTCKDFPSVCSHAHSEWRSTQPNSQTFSRDTDYTDDRHDPSAVQRLDGFTLLP